MSIRKIPLKEQPPFRSEDDAMDIADDDTEDSEVDVALEHLDRPELAHLRSGSAACQKGTVASSAGSGRRLA